jgi:hypothetical protein
MTASPLPRILARLLVMVVAAGSGIYLIVYLYRWEWNRALISGLFFVAAEIAYVGTTLRDEIRGLGSRVDALEGPGRGHPSATSDASGARPTRPFAWLREVASGPTSVFVPVLLGAGVILSGLAFVVERIAAFVAHPSAERGGTRRPVPLALPPGGLLDPAGAPAARARPAALRAQAIDHRAPGIGRRLVALAVLGLLVAAAVDMVADATQSRPSARVPDTSTVVELAVEQRRPAPAIEAGEALAVACQGTLHADSEFTEIVPAEADHVRLTVTPALSELRRRRLFGCLQDATLDLVQAHVVDWSTQPAPPAPPSGGADYS